MNPLVMEVKNSTCITVTEFHNTSFSVEWAMPEWEAILTIVTLTLCILLTIVGNVLVILGVFTYKPLRIVQNFFIVSLAVADLTVAILVMPLNVAYSVLGRLVLQNELNVHEMRVESGQTLVSPLVGCIQYWFQMAAFTVNPSALSLNVSNNTNMIFVSLGKHPWPTRILLS